jgi:hypothetical protein
MAATKLSAFAEELVEPLETPRRAVARAFYETPGRMDIRKLWSSGHVHYFRVNFWQTRGGVEDQYIWCSRFVMVEDTFDGYVVHEMNQTCAA